MGRWKTSVCATNVTPRKGRNQEGGPPVPKLSKQDRRRIRKYGPSKSDVTITVQDENGHVHPMLPANVMGETFGQPAVEPDWKNLPRMPFMEFYQGLRERNWTSDYFVQSSDPWKVDVFRDGGRSWKSSFWGKRILVTQLDGQQAWVNVPFDGAKSFLNTNLSGGRHGLFGGMERKAFKYDLRQYGYNQIKEELEGAFQRRLPEEFNQEEVENGISDDPNAYPYDCPGEYYLDVGFYRTPSEPDVVFLDDLPAMVFILGAAGFIVVSLFFGIFKPRKAMPSDPVQAIEFGQSKGLARKEGKTSIKFDDVGGLGREVEEFQEVVEFLKDPIRFTTLGAKPPKGLLLEGGPGTGKTLVAKAIAGEAGVPFYEMSGSEFVEIIVGVGAARVRDLFKRARINAPCIIFIDEIDALGFARADSQTQTNEEREQTLNQLLTEMDGFTPDTGVVLVAATNRADLLDPALMRAGRFDRKIKIQLPTEEGRFEILKVHARKHRVAPGLDLRQLARDLPGLSGAELANLMNEAALTAVRRDAGEIHDVDVYAAMDRILEGAKRPGLSRKLGVVYGLAVHEAGVAIAASILRMRKDCVEEIRRVSMVPRGKDWTRTVFVYSSDDAYTPITRARLLEQIQVLLAGRAAEEVVFGSRHGPSTYGTGDLNDATALATRLVGNYGLSERGIVTLIPELRGDQLKRNMGMSQIASSATSSHTEVLEGITLPTEFSKEMVGFEVHEILKVCYAEVCGILSEHRGALLAVADRLLDSEQIFGEELVRILEAGGSNKSTQLGPGSSSPLTEGAVPYQASWEKPRPRTVP
eukprot:jgi/Pico_ML_1/55531/g1204.t1